MARYLLIALGVYYALAFFAIIGVLRTRKPPVSMLAWIFALLTLPFIGLALYMLMSGDRVRRKAGRRRQRLAGFLNKARQRTEERTHKSEVVFPPPLAPDLSAVERLGERLAKMPAVDGNLVQVWQEANATYAAIEDAIRKARHHIHLEYYIWQPDETGRHFRDLLIERARAGIEVRLLLDSVGCFKLGKRFLRPLTDAGAEVAFFLPLYPLRKRWTLHLRNHRKIVVVDGQTAFTGSQNIGEEYRGRLKALSPWYDSHMSIRGPASLYLQQTFVEDWAFATKRDLDGDAYFPQPRRAGESIVQILPTGPDNDINVLGQIVFAAVSAARDTIRIATPYFVPDQGLMMALTHAVYLGVRVKLVVPTRSDAPLALWAGRSFYRELVDAGVEVYEFDSGVLHSKLITVDDRWCMIGSANMDVRSFRLNFEITALVYDSGVTQDLTRMLEERCGQARRITQRDVWRSGLGAQLLEGSARLFAPLL